MRTHSLGRHGPQFSVIGLGSIEAVVQYSGTGTAKETVKDAVNAVLDAGVNWIDTAEVYDDGQGEELIGEAVAARRKEVYLATKVAPKVSSIAWGGTGHRPEEIAAACRGSLKRLGTDWIDLYHLHAPDESGVPMEETWGAMAKLVEEGLVRHIGVSNFAQPLVERCMAVHHVDSVQNEFSMAYRVNRALAQWCGEQGIGYLAYAPLSYGLMAGAIHRDDAPEAFWRQPGRSPQFLSDVIDTNLKLVDDVRQIAGRLGVSLPQLSLAWVFHQAGVTAAIAGGGAINPRFAVENAAAGDLELSATVLEEIEQLLAEPASAA